MSDDRIAKVAVASILAIGVGITSNPPSAQADTPKMEKCYGIAKQAMNECGAYDHSCEGQSKRDKDPNEWIYVPTGTCKKIVGGTLKPADLSTLPGANKATKNSANETSPKNSERTPKNPR